MIKPGICVSDKGKVTLIKTYANSIIHYTTDGTTPSATSNHTYDVKTDIGTYPAGTIIKAVQVNDLNSADISEVNQVKVLSETGIDSLIFTKVKQNFGTAVLTQSSNNDKWLGSFYVTFDGTNPAENGIEITDYDFTSTTRSCKINYQTGCNYTVRVCIKYNNTVGNSDSWDENGGINKTMFPPTISHEYGAYTATENGTASGIRHQRKYISDISRGYTNAHPSFPTDDSSDWTSFTSLVHEHAYIYLFRSCRQIPDGQTGNQRRWLYTDIVTVKNPIPEPKIYDDYTPGYLVIETRSNCKTYYYTIYRGVASQPQQYTTPLSLGNLGGVTVVAYNDFSYEEHFDYNNQTINYTSRSNTVKYEVGSDLALEAPLVTASNGVVVMTNPNDTGDIYYTVDETIPTKASKLYTGMFMLYKDTIVKAIVISDAVGLSSNVTTFEFKYNEANPASPYIRKTKGENVNLKTTKVKNYLDIIYNEGYEITKVLDSISYIVNIIDNKFLIDNIAEEDLDKRFSGNNLIIYTDECYSGLLSLAKPSAVNSLADYKYPHWNKGHWTLNYFRDNIKTGVTDEELEGYTIFPYYNAERRRDETRTISIAKLKKANAQDNITGRVPQSDNRSLIFGKYIVTRFIFNNTKRIKFETIQFNIKPY